MLRRLPLVLAVLLLLPLASAQAGDPWENEPAFKTLVKYELKTLRTLMQDAVKKDYRRQAWYLADRILQVDPADGEAANVLDMWDTAELQAGQTPKKGWAKKRDSTLRKLGDDYFHFGETLEASGMDPEKYYPINVRAHSYGSEAGPLMTAIKQAGYAWIGVYGAKPQAEIEKLLRGPLYSYAWPREFDDEYLAARCVWPEARGAQWRRWRLLTDHDYKEALRLLGMLAQAESWMVKVMGSKAKKSADSVTDILVFSEWQKYDKIGADIVRERDADRFTGTSGFHDRRRDRLLVCWRHRHNGWLGDDDLMLGHAAKVMARNHFAPGAGGSVRGRGAWLLDGLRGAFEGFRLDQDGKGEIDAAACWRLAVARALRDENKLLDWQQFIELDDKKAREVPRVPLLKVHFGGAEREAKNVDVVAAQATALVVGLMKADGGKKLKKMGKLIADLFKRDSLPDIEKTLGLKKGKALAMARIAMDAAHGGKIK